MIARSVAMRWALAILTYVVSPGALSTLLLLGGSAAATCGVYVLAGLGWALIAAAVPALLLGSILLRGVLHGV